MIRNHKLSSDFDISETFREKIKAKKNRVDVHVDRAKVENLIAKKDKIAKIHNTVDGMYLISTGDKRYSVSHDELVLIVRESPHLFYSKKNKLFLNLKLIRVIEKRNNEKVSLYYKYQGEILEIETKYDEVEDLMFFLEDSEYSNLSKSDFDYFKEKHFKTSVVKYVRRNLFEFEYKNLKLNNNLSLATVFSSSLFYLIPFIPFVGLTKYSTMIFPITTFLIGLLLFQRSENKKKLIELK